MLNLSITERGESLRREFRTWLTANPAPNVGDASLETFIAVSRAWQARLASGRWVGVHWDEVYGGRGLSLVEEAIIQEELVRANSPQLLGLFGLTMVGPVLIEHGTAEQKSRLVPAILNASELWCQGFSEPGAGSDLAAVKTKAEATKDGFLVTGQKVWTSFAQIADWCFALCRTSEGAKKHEGLTYLLIPMKSKGITVRPLRQISGDLEFNEVFFDRVEVPQENLVGSVGQGWKIAISTLMFERVVLTFARQLQSESLLRQLLTKQAALSSRQREDLAAAVATACATRALAYSHLMEYANGKKPGAEGSADKLLWSESFQQLAKLELATMGARAALGEHDESVGEGVHRYLYSRGRTIAAGTSEIQRSIIAERLIGLPRLKISRQ